MSTVLYCTENSFDQIYSSVLYWTDRQIFQLNYQNNSCSEHSCYWLSWKDTWSFVSVRKDQLICIEIVKMDTFPCDILAWKYPVLGYSSYSQTEKYDFWLQFHTKNCIVFIVSTEFGTESWRWWGARDFWWPSRCSNRSHRVVIAKVSWVGV